MERQLSDSISQQAALLITNGTKSGNLVALLGAHNISLVIGEGNSNSEPGELGVCDVFAGSALWAIDTFFELARVGLRRFHVHSHEADLRSPIFFQHPPEPHTLPWVRLLHPTLPHLIPTEHSARGTDEMSCACGLCCVVWGGRCARCGMACASSP